MRSATYCFVWYRWRWLACLAGLLSGILPASVAYAQAPAWQSVVASSGANVAYAKACAAGPDGAVYVLGNFYDTIRLGAQTLRSNGEGSDVFIARWNPATGQFGWAQRLGGRGHEEAAAIAVQDNHVYVTGTFTSDTLQVGKQMLRDTVPVVSDRYGDYHPSEVFVARLTDLGTAAITDWGLATGTVPDEAAPALAVAGPDIYLLSGPGFSGSRPRFLSHLHDDEVSGRILWTKQLSNSGGEVIAARQNAVYLAGAGTFSEDDTEAAHADSSSQAGSNGFVARLRASDGHPEWLQPLFNNSSSSIKLKALTVSGQKLYLAGALQGDTLRLGQLPLTAAQGAVFVARLTDEGLTARLDWARSFEGSDNDEPTALTARGSQVYVTGFFCEARLAVDPNRIVLHRRSWPGNITTFVARLTDLDTTARVAWAKRAGIVGVRQTKIIHVANCFHGGKHRQRLSRGVQPLGLALSGPQLCLLGETDGAVRLGTHRLSCPPRRRYRLFLASLRAD